MLIIINIIIIIIINVEHIDWWDNNIKMDFEEKFVKKSEMK